MRPLREDDPIILTPKSAKSAMQTRLATGLDSSSRTRRLLLRESARNCRRPTRNDTSALPRSGRSAPLNGRAFSPVQTPSALRISRDGQVDLLAPITPVTWTD